MDRVLPEIQYKSQPLDRVYSIVWLDAVHYKVMDNKNRPVTRAIYNVLALTTEGRKELLGMHLSKRERERERDFWTRRWGAQRIAIYLLRITLLCVTVRLSLD